MVPATSWTGMGQMAPAAPAVTNQWMGDQTMQTAAFGNTLAPAFNAGAPLAPAAMPSWQAQPTAAFAPQALAPAFPGIMADAGVQQNPWGGLSQPGLMPMQPAPALAPAA